MEKRLRVLPIASTIGMFSGLLYVLCATALYLFPEATIAVFRTWFHGVQITSTIDLRLGSLIIGFLSFVISTVIAGTLFVIIYNRCYDHCKKKEWM